MAREHVCVAQCPKCDQWQAFQTDSLSSYQFTCMRCTYTKTVKDQERGGGFNVSLEFVDGTMRDASRLVSELNKYNCERIQSVIEKEKEKPAHRQRNINELVKDIEPRTGFASCR